MRVLAERVSLFYVLLTKDFRISNAPVKPLKKGIGELKRQLGEAKMDLKKLVTGVTEFQSKNVVREMSVIVLPRPQSILIARSRNEY